MDPKDVARGGTLGKINWWEGEWYITGGLLVCPIGIAGRVVKKEKSADA